jgi:uncharacterized C2H2 Zn-finger protein
MVKAPTKGARRHACPQCDYKAGQASDLRQHVRVVHEKRKDHACPHCDRKFGEGGSMRRHVRREHSWVDAGGINPNAWRT